MCVCWMSCLAAGPHRAAVLTVARLPNFLSVVAHQLYLAVGSIVSDVGVKDSYQISAKTKDI